MLLHNLFLGITLLLFLGEPIYLGPKSLGPYNIGHETKMSSILKMVGSPGLIKGSYSCFMSNDKESFFWVAEMAHAPEIVGQVLISDFPNCRGDLKRITHASFLAWKTDKDIRLGSKEDTVIKAYGKPSRESKVEGSKFRWIIRGQAAPVAGRQEIGDKVLVYSGAEGDLRTAFFGIRQGTVAWISLSANE
jgi:hypothetical protein